MLKQLYADVTALLETHGASTHTKAEVDRVFAAAEAAAEAATPTPTPSPTPEPSEPEL